MNGYIGSSGFRHGETAEPEQNTAVRWVQVTLASGISVLRDKTFYEFSEIIGHDTQESVPLADGFEVNWKGRGVLLELKQDGVRVTGYYDGDGKLNGVVSGNLLQATGRDRRSGVPSTFVLGIGNAGSIVGVRSSNRAPFRLYSGDPAPGISTSCSEQVAQPLGCEATTHGIDFDSDSATLRPATNEVLDALSTGLMSVAALAVVAIGHTSSEANDAYNLELSQRRAKAIVAAIVARGAEPHRISAEGRGEQEPIADNSTEIGRSLNRRVEIVSRPGVASRRQNENPLRHPC